MSYNSLLADAALLVRLNGDANLDGTGDANDISGNAAHGTWSGTPAYDDPVTVWGRKSFDFSGATYIDVALDPVLDLDEPQTAVAWVHWLTASGGANTNPRVFSLENGLENSVNEVNGRIQCYGQGPTAQTGSGVISVNNTYLLAVTQSGLARTVYLNGASVASSSGLTASLTSSLLRIGNSQAADRKLRGQMEDMRLYSRALSQPEIAEIFAGPEPVCTVAPVATGTATEGQELSCTTGTWGLPVEFSGSNGTITYAYQWTRSNDGSGTGEADIGSATSSTYTLTATDVGKYIRCRVRASNTGGYDLDAASNFTDAISSGVVVPIEIVPPFLGSQVYETQTHALLIPGVYSPEPDAYAYQWQEFNDPAWEDISGETDATLELQVGWAGKVIRCAVIPSLAGNPGAASYSAGFTVLAEPAVPVQTAEPLVTGNVVPGEVLTTTPGTWSDAAAVFRTAWITDDQSFGGAVQQSGYTATGSFRLRYSATPGKYFCIREIGYSAGSVHVITQYTYWPITATITGAVAPVIQDGRLDTFAEASLASRLVYPLGSSADRAYWSGYGGTTALTNGTVTRNAACWARDIDLTGVGHFFHASTQCYGFLISPWHIVVPKHDSLSDDPVGTSVGFYDPDQSPKLVTTTIASKVMIDDDFAVCKLTAAAPDWAKVYRIPAAILYHADFVSRILWIGGLSHNWHCMIGQASYTAAGSNFTFTKITSDAYADSAVGNDSSGPVGFICGDEFVPITVLRTAPSLGGQGLNTAYHATAIQAAMDTLGPGSLTLGRYTPPSPQILRDDDQLVEVASSVNIGAAASLVRSYRRNGSVIAGSADALDLTLNGEYLRRDSYGAVSSDSNAVTVADLSDQTPLLLRRRRAAAGA